MQKVRLLFLLLLAPLFAYGQVADFKPVVYGTVTDGETKEPAIDVLVRITFPGGGWVAARADLEGKYRLSLPWTGKCILLVACSGYYSEFIPFIADSAKTYTHDIVLCNDPVQEARLPGPFDMNVPRSSDDAPRTSGTAKTKRTGGKLLFPPEHDSAWMGIDSFALTGIRRASKDQLATSLFRNGKIYRFNDTTWYFHKGYCPAYAIYYQRGNSLYAAEPYYEKRVPRQIIFRKTRKGYVLKSDWGTSVRMEKL